MRVLRWELIVIGTASGTREGGGGAEGALRGMLTTASRRSRD